MRFRNIGLSFYALQQNVRRAALFSAARAMLRCELSATSRALYIGNLNASFLEIIY